MIFIFRSRAPAAQHVARRLCKFYIRQSQIVGGQRPPEAQQMIFYRPRSPVSLCAVLAGFNRDFNSVSKSVM